MSQSRTYEVLTLIAAERLRQNQQHGAQRDMPLTRPGMRYMEPERVARATYERRRAEGTLSHADIIVEESAEAFDAETPGEQLKEAIQAAACWVKALEAMIWQSEQDK